MALRITCGHCQKQVTVKDELAGKRLRCAACKQVLSAGPAAASAPIERPARAGAGRLPWLAAGTLGLLAAAALVYALVVGGQAQSLAESLAAAQKAQQEAAQHRDRERERAASAEAALKQAAAAALKAQQSMQLDELDKRLATAEQEATKTLTAQVADLTRRLGAAEQQTSKATAALKAMEKAQAERKGPSAVEKPAPAAVAGAQTASAPVGPGPSTGSGKQNKIWQQAKVARLHIALPSVLDGQPAAREEVKVEVAAQKVQQHMDRALEAVNKKDFSLARMRSVADTAIGMVTSDCVIYLFADSEEQWPGERLPWEMKVQGMRLNAVTVSSLIAAGLGGAPPTAQVTNSELARKIGEVIAGARNSGKAAGEPFVFGRYQLALTGTAMDERGVVRGKLSGRIPEGSVLKDAWFIMTPCTAAGKPIEAESPPPTAAPSAVPEEVPAEQATRNPDGGRDSFAVSLYDRTTGKLGDIPQATIGKFLEAGQAASLDLSRPADREKLIQKWQELAGDKADRQTVTIWVANGKQYRWPPSLSASKQPERSQTTAPKQGVGPRPPDQKPGAAWQSDWGLFIAELAPYFKKGVPIAEVKAKFEGQVVAWEGEVRDVGKLIKLKMPANKLTLSNGGAAEIEYLVLEPLGENAKKWAAVPAGSRVRFRTTLKSSLFPVVVLLQGVGESRPPPGSGRECGQGSCDHLDARWRTRGHHRRRALTATRKDPALQSLTLLARHGRRGAEIAGAECSRYAQGA